MNSKFFFTSCIFSLCTITAQVNFSGNYINFSSDTWLSTKVEKITPCVSDEAIDQLRLRTETFDPMMGRWTVSKQYVAFTQDGFLVAYNWGKYRISCWRIAGHDNTGNPIMEPVDTEDIFTRKALHRGTIFWDTADRSKQQFYFTHKAERMRAAIVLGGIAIACMTVAYRYLWSLRDMQQKITKKYSERVEISGQNCASEKEKLMQKQRALEKTTDDLKKKIKASELQVSQNNTKIGEVVTKEWTAENEVLDYNKHLKKERLATGRIEDYMRKGIEDFALLRTNHARMESEMKNILEPLDNTQENGNSVPVNSNDTGIDRERFCFVCYEAFSDSIIKIKYPCFKDHGMCGGCMKRMRQYGGDIADNEPYYFECPNCKKALCHKYKPNEHVIFG
jgi:hypothetical protein